jgi:glycosyltransferase involved in cell wall biosynthesis
MKILVIDVAAEYAGAMTILEEVLSDSSLHPDHSFDFYVSQTTLMSYKSSNVNITVLPWVKKSWLHRLYFEFYYLSKIIKSGNYDVIVSLQNVLFLKDNKAKSVVFIHQSLQYLTKIPNILTLEGLKILARKYLIGPLIHYSAAKADVTIVQSNWMRAELIKRGLVDEGRVKTISHSFTALNNSVDRYRGFKFQEFVYPAAAGALKNHMFILDSMIELQQRGLNPKVYFTFRASENQTARKLFRMIQRYHLNIKLIGRLEREELLTFMSDKTILFPSLIETFGLPLYEAMSIKAPIIALDRAYSREALENYSDAYFVDRVEDQVKIMKSVLDDEVEYNGGRISAMKNSSKGIVETIISIGEN